MFNSAKRMVHIADEDDTPRMIARLRGVAVADLLQWNRPLFPGLTQKSKFRKNTTVWLKLPPPQVLSPDAPAGASGNAGLTKAVASPKKSKSTPHGPHVTTHHAKRRPTAATSNLPPRGGGGGRGGGAPARKRTRSVASAGHDGSAEQHSDVCCICHADYRRAEVILCDGVRPNGQRCNKEFHIFCLKPALTSIPSGDFFGPCCTSQKPKKQNKAGVSKCKKQKKKKQKQKKTTESKPKKQGKQAGSGEDVAVASAPLEVPTCHTYLSKKGETLQNVADLFCLDEATIVPLNRHLRNVDINAPLATNTDVVVPSLDALRRNNNRSRGDDAAGLEAVEAHDTVADRTVFYADEGDTLASIARMFGLAAVDLVAVNAPLYPTLTAEAALLQDTPVYVHSTAGVTSLRQHTPGQTGVAEQPLRSCCFLYHARENDTACKLGTRFGVDCEDIIRLNTARHPDLSRSALLRKDTSLYIPCDPSGIGTKVDLAYAFSKLDMAAQPSFPDCTRQLCLFVANAKDSISRLCDRLGVSSDYVVLVNQHLHDEITATAALMHGTALFIPALASFWDSCLVVWSCDSVAAMANDDDDVGSDAT